MANSLNAEQCNIECVLVFVYCMAMPSFALGIDRGLIVGENWQQNFVRCKSVDAHMNTGTPNNGVMYAMRIHFGSVEQ